MSNLVKANLEFEQINGQQLNGLRCEPVYNIRILQQKQIKPSATALAA